MPALRGYGLPMGCDCAWQAMGRQDGGATAPAPPQPAGCRRCGPAPGRQDAGATGLALALSRPLARLGVALCGGGYQGKRGMTIAVDGVVVDHANGLHEGVTDS